MQYRSEYDVIYCTRLHLDDLPSLLATIHDVVDKRGYSTVRLDFTECSFIYPAAVLALCSVSSKLRSSNIDTYLILPKKSYCQIWCMAFRPLSLLIARLPACHL